MAAAATDRRWNSFVTNGTKPPLTIAARLLSLGWIVEATVVSMPWLFNAGGRLWSWHYHAPLLWIVASMSRRRYCRLWPPHYSGWGGMPQLASYYRCRLQLAHVARLHLVDIAWVR
jgi:hypothetical protein